MFDLLFVVSLIVSSVQLVNEIREPVIPAENWANKNLYYEDMANGIPIEQRMKNLENGKYKLTKTYPEPHKDANGKIIIENNLLYKADVKKYGAVQAEQWVKQGKYNLTPEEFKKERERIKADIKRKYGIEIST